MRKAEEPEPDPHTDPYHTNGLTDSDANPDTDPEHCFVGTLTSFFKDNMLFRSPKQ
jgi:hypothetical protein